MLYLLSTPVISEVTDAGLQVPAAFCPEASWAWHVDCRHLTLLFGSAWGWPTTTLDAPSGLAFVDSDSDTATVVLLPMQPPERSAQAHFCPCRALVLLQHVDADACDVLSVYDCKGRLVSRVAAPEPGLARLEVIWAPSAQQVALGATERQRVWLWKDLAWPEVTRLQPTSLDHWLWAWATPYDTGLVCCAQGSTLVYTKYTGCYRHAKLASVPLGQATGEVVYAKWGRLLVLLVRTSQAAAVHPQGCDQLQLYFVVGGSLILDSVVSALPCLFAADREMQVSSDGEHLAVILVHPGNEASYRLGERQLAVVCLASGTMQKFSLYLPGLHDPLDLSVRLTLRWVPDDTAVLVFVPGRRCRLVSWA